MKKIFTCLIFLNLFWVHEKVYGTTEQFIENLSFGSLSTKDGLSQNTVQCIIKDRFGFLWFGTQDGLNRYDGYFFKQYQDFSQADNVDKDKSISDRYIKSLFEDSAGNLWIGTMSGGLNLYNRKTGKFEHFLHTPSDETSISDNNIWKIFEDSTASLWIGTKNGGLNRMDRQTGKFERFLPDKSKKCIHDISIQDIAEDKSGLLWLAGSSNGLALFNKQTGTFKIYSSKKDDIYSIPSNSIRALLVDSRGILWVGTASGLARYNRDKDNFIVYKNRIGDNYSLGIDDINILYEDRDGRIWIGHKSGGISIYEIQTNSFYRIKSKEKLYGSLSDDHIKSIYQEENGNIWIGTFVGGINTYCPNANRFKLYFQEWWKDNYLSNNTIRSFYKDNKGSLYIGTEYGLNVYNYQTKKYTWYISDGKTGLPHNIIRAVSPDSNGNLWLATHNGLSRFNMETKNFQNYFHDSKDKNSICNKEVFRVLVDTEGLIWSGGDKGLDVLDTKTGQFTSFMHNQADKNTISGDRILLIYEDSLKNIWISPSLKGLNYYIRETGEWLRFANDADDPESLTSNAVWSVCEDRQGTIWVGTRTGLNKFNRNTGKFKFYTEKNGLSNNTIYGILEDKSGNLWMSTNRGISCFNPKKEIFKNYYVTDGLQNNEFNNGAFYKTTDGEMFFGGVAGFNSFYPESIKQSNYMPPVVITSFKIFNEEADLPKSLEETEEINLKYYDSYIAFQFASLDYTSPNKNRYAYKLEGYNNDWVSAENRRFAEYTFLQPGDYTFMVKGSNSDGVWSDNIRKTRITIPPPPWKTWWAYILYFLFVSGVIINIILRREKINRQKLAQKQMFLEAASRFVPEAFLKHLNMDSIIDIKLGDCSLKKMSILFSDLRSFTSISEKMTPEENFKYLNSYLGKVSPIIRKNNGFIDKYIGDAIMALFDGEPDDAIQAAVAMFRKLENYNEELITQDLPVIKMGIGIHYGLLMLGTIGELKRMETTVISDTVNLASRLEGMTKFYNASLLISETVYDNLAHPDNYYIRLIDKVQAKGKSEPIKIYEVIDVENMKIRTAKIASLEKYNQALDHYYKKEFNNALEILTECKKNYPKDKIIDIYIERAKKFLEEGIVDNWEGTTQLFEK